MKKRREKLVQEAKKLAANSPQVTLAWIDGTERTYPASKAVVLCEVPRITACIMGVVACGDRKLENMLTKLIDNE